MPIIFSPTYFVRLVHHSDMPSLAQGCCILSLVQYCWLVVPLGIFRVQLSRPWWFRSTFIWFNVNARVHLVDASIMLSFLLIDSSALYWHCGSSVSPSMLSCILLRDYRWIRLNCLFDSFESVIVTQWINIIHINKVSLQWLPRRDIVLFPLTDLILWLSSSKGRVLNSLRVASYWWKSLRVFSTRSSSCFWREDRLDIFSISLLRMLSWTPIRSFLTWLEMYFLLYKALTLECSFPKAITWLKTSFLL